MTLEFAVIILQNKQDGTANISRTPYATETEAWKAFYRSCGNAVDSENLTDAVIIMNKAPGTPFPLTSAITSARWSSSIRKKS